MNTTNEMVDYLIGRVCGLKQELANADNQILGLLDENTELTQDLTEFSEQILELTDENYGLIEDLLESKDKILELVSNQSMHQLYIEDLEILTDVLGSQHNVNY